MRLIALTPNKDQVIASCNLGYSVDVGFERKNLIYLILKYGINYIKDEFQLHRIMTNHLPNNIRSEKLLERLGFEKEGYVKNYLKINGE